MDMYYNGEHSVKFGNFRVVVDNGVARLDDTGFVDAWTKWGLVPKSLPVIPPPPVVQKQVEVYGANSVIDLTEVPRGFPTYQNRTGSLTFYVDGSDKDFDWVKVLNSVTDYLHGFSMKMMLDDDRANYYYGRFSVDGWSAGSHINEISIGYDLDPYKYSIFSTAEPWLWNPFDFEHDIIPVFQNEFIDIDVSTTTYKIWTSDVCGRMPVIPKFTLRESISGVDIYIYNSVRGEVSETVHISNGDTEDVRLELCTPKPGSYSEIHFSGDGLLTIDFRPGRL